MELPLARETGGERLALFTDTFLSALDFSSCAQSILICKMASGTVWVAGFESDFVFFFIPFYTKRIKIDVFKCCKTKPFAAPGGGKSRSLTAAEVL